MTGWPLLLFDAVVFLGVVTIGVGVVTWVILHRIECRLDEMAARWDREQP